MQKNNIQIIVFVILLLFGAIIWFLPVLQKGEKALCSSAKLQNDYLVEELISVEDFVLSQEKLEAKRPQLSWGRDPFLMSAKTSEEKELMLSGVAVDEKGKIAIINNEIVREGDMILGAKIIEIKEDSVTIEKDGKIDNLKTFEDVE
jgi:type II secretory pathway component PulC